MLKTDLAKAERLFRDAGLGFPSIPEELAFRLKVHGEWLFSTRPIDLSPYNLQEYVREAAETPLDDYVILAHSGHGVNSYAIQYYLVCGPLRMFLHLGWGGGYVDMEAESAKVRECLSLADEIVLVVAERKVGRPTVTIVCSDFYGSFWTQRTKPSPRYVRYRATTWTPQHTSLSAR